MLLLRGVGRRRGSTMVAALGFIIVDLMIFYLVLRRLQWWYMRYVLTDFRVVHTRGILKRHARGSRGPRSRTSR